MKRKSKNRQMLNRQKRRKTLTLVSTARDLSRYLAASCRLCHLRTRQPWRRMVETTVVTPKSHCLATYSVIVRRLTQSQLLVAVCLDQVPPVKRRRSSLAPPTTRARKIVYLVISSRLAARSLATTVARPYLVATQSRFSAAQARIRPRHH